MYGKEFRQFVFFGFCMFIVKVQYLIISYCLAIFVDKGILNMYNILPPTYRCNI